MPGLPTTATIISMFPVSRKPYIFMSAVGTHHDIGTLLHEGGHALHSMEAFSQPLIWNQDAPAEFAEVASMGMELLAAPYLARSRGGFYSDCLLYTSDAADDL